MLAERFSAFLHRHRFAILAVWVVHAFLLHLLVIGFTSWDGFSYRVPPIIELVQHGSFGMEKYNQWAFGGYIPFVELVHVPFVIVFKMAGLIVGFPLLLFPLCVAAVFLFAREVTGEPKAAVFGALTYAAVPATSQQPYSGLVDFVVIGALAFLLYAILRARTTKTTVWTFVRIALATILLTLSRSTTLFLLVFLLPFVAYAFFFEREGWRIRLAKRRELILIALAIGCGVVPALGIMVYKFLHYGSPIYPYQFQFLGQKIGLGVSTKELFSYAGLRDETPAAYWRSFVSAWLWPEYWPPGLLCDSRHFGGGLVFYVVLLMIPTFVRTATRTERWLVAACVVVSFLARDFWLPRWAYTLNVAFVVIVTRSMAALARSVKWRPVFWTAAAVLAVHLGRPEFDLVTMMKEPGGMGPRLNVAGSSFFPPGPMVVDMFPDMHGRFVIVESSAESFLLQIYGRRLTNEVVSTVRKDDIGEGCSKLVEITQRDPSILFIDDHGYTQSCDRECAVMQWSGCRAYRIKPKAYSTNASLPTQQ